MNARKKRAEAVAIAPEGAVNAIGLNYFRTKNQNPSAKNYETVRDRVIITVREKGYVDVADEMRTGVTTELTRPTMPRKKWKAIQRKKKKKRPTKVEPQPEVEVVDTTVSGPSPPEEGMEAAARKVFIVKKEPGEEDSDSDSDSSFDSEVEEARYLYDVEMDEYKDKKDEIKKRKEKIREGRPYARDILLAQCTRDMVERLKAMEDYSKVVEDSDVIALLKMIKACGLDYSEDGYIVHNAVHVLRELLTYTQGREQTNQDFRDELDARYLKMVQIGGDLGRLFEFKDGEHSKLPDEELRERILAVMTIGQACEERFGGFKKDRIEDAHLGRSDYPATRSRAAVALDNHCSDVLKPKARIGGTRDDQTTNASFVQVDVLKGKDGKPCVAGKDGGIYPEIDCRHCGRYGHYMSACPTKYRKKKKDSESDDEVEENEVVGKLNFVANLWDEDIEETDPNQEYTGENGNFQCYTFTRGEVPPTEEVLKGLNCFLLADDTAACFSTKVARKSEIDGRLICLLDTGASDHVICNSALLLNIRPAAKPKKMTTNAGVFWAKMVGTFPGIGTVYYDPTCVVNIVSWTALEDSNKFVITHHGKGTSGGVSRFSVRNIETGKKLWFRRKYGVFVIEVDAGALYSSVANSISDDITNYVHATVETVVKNEAAYSARDVARAKAVLPLIQAMGYPSRKDLNLMLKRRSINNCPVTLSDVERFYKIYGGVEGAIKGKTKRKAPVEVRTDENTTTVPKSLAQDLKVVTLAIDIFFIERAPFLTGISRKIMFSTAMALKSRKHN